MFRFLFALSLFAGTVIGTAATAHAGVADFSLKNAKNKKVSLSDFKGQVVVINFWATWCKPCKQELPFLNKYYKELKDQGLVVLAISTDDARTRAAVRKTVKQKKLKMPVLLDPDGKVTATLNPRVQMPYTLYVDHEGNEAGHHDGFTSGDEVKMLAKIKELLAKRNASPEKGTP